MIKVYLLEAGELVFEIEDDQGHEFTVQFTPDDALAIKRLVDDPTDDILELEGEVQ